jgi:hypothetical protein
MATLTAASARAMRDGGIDAMAALDAAVRRALVGIAPEDAGELKQIFGKVMCEVVSEIINPAIRAFPELAVDESAWSEIARAQAGARCQAAAVEKLG